jgi:hypothetical protein
LWHVGHHTLDEVFLRISSRSDFGEHALPQVHKDAPQLFAGAGEGAAEAEAVAHGCSVWQDLDDLWGMDVPEERMSGG